MTVQTMSRKFGIVASSELGGEYLGGKFLRPTPSRRSPNCRRRRNPARPTDRISALVQKLFLGSGTVADPVRRLPGLVGKWRLELRFARRRSAYNWRSQVGGARLVWWTQFEGPSVSTGFFLEGKRWVGLSDAVDHSPRRREFCQNRSRTNQSWILPAGRGIRAPWGRFTAQAWLSASAVTN